MNPSLFLSCAADPTRYQILCALEADPACVNDLVAATGQSQPNVSHHLRQLRDCGLVTYDRAGKENHYRLAHPAITDFLSTVRAASIALAPMCACEVCQ